MTKVPKASTFNSIHFKDILLMIGGFLFIGGIKDIIPPLSNLASIIVGLVLLVIAWRMKG